MKKLFGALLVTVAIVGTGAAHAGTAAKRSLFNELDQLRARDSMALQRGGQLRTSHEKEWADFLPRVKREFGADHACVMAAQHSQGVWRALNDALFKPTPGTLDLISKLAFNAGGWEAECSDAVDKAGQ